MFRASGTLPKRLASDRLWQRRSIWTFGAAYAVDSCENGGMADRNLSTLRWLMTSVVRRSTLRAATTIRSCIAFWRGYSCARARSCTWKEPKISIELGSTKPRSRRSRTLPDPGPSRCARPGSPHSPATRSPTRSRQPAPSGGSMPVKSAGTTRPHPPSPLSESEHGAPDADRRELADTEDAATLPPVPDANPEDSNRPNSVSRPVAPTPESGRVAPNTDRRELADIGDAVVGPRTDHSESRD